METIGPSGSKALLRVLGGVSWRSLRFEIFLDAGTKAFNRKDRKACLARCGCFAGELVETDPLSCGWCSSWLLGAGHLSVSFVCSVGQPVGRGRLATLFLAYFRIGVGDFGLWDDPE